MSLTINAKPTAPNTRLPLLLTATAVPGADQLKAHWLSEIQQYASDSLALHEHTADDLRIDATQVKPDSEYEPFHLPIQRKASYESDGIRPSEVAKDHFLTEEERAFYAKQHAEDQKILEQQQKEFIEQKTRITTATSSKATVSSVSASSASSSAATTASTVTQVQKTQATEKEAKQLVESSSSAVATKTVERHAKLSRSEAIEQPHGIDTKVQIQSESETKSSAKSSAIDQRKSHEQTTVIATGGSTQQQQIEAKQVSQDTSSVQAIAAEKVHKIESSAAQIVQKEDRAAEIKEVAAPAPAAATAAAATGKKEHVASNTPKIVDSSRDDTSRKKHNQSVKFDIDDKNLTIASSFDTINKMSQPSSSSPPPPSSQQPTTNAPSALDMHTTAMPTNNNTSSNSNTNQEPNDGSRCVTIATTNTTPAANNQTNSSHSLAEAYNNNPISLAPGQRLQTISIYNFGNSNAGGGGGGGGGGGRPLSLPPGFLVPSHLITYETSIEINFRKIPPPQPPPPPKFIKKMLLHTESLERRTRAFLNCNFEVGTTDNALRTARQKIRSLKSTILKSDDEVKHAEDTIHKAQSGDFLNIFAPPIVEQPLYEFIEVPAHRSEDELSADLDRRSERSQSSVQQQQQQEQELDNMADYYSSKYSSRSSRRRVEGKLFVCYSLCSDRFFLSSSSSSRSKYLFAIHFISFVLSCYC